MPLIDANALNCFYFALLLAGVLYAFFLMLAGGLHAIHLPALDIDLGGLHIPGLHAGHIDIGGAGHEVSLLSLSPISISAFVTSFGGIGLIATLGLGLGGLASVFWAAIGSAVIAIISHVLFFYLFIAPQASSALTTSDIVGQVGEVTVPIPASSVGEIAYIAMGERHTATARTADGSALARGALVMIESIAGTVLIVKPK